ncbi:alkaline phosphatase family protein [Paludisphaera sp.]|uniref:alkaline phosphatase family protein n=1 Tax=Paludisphaera sp. TaxID=2017432 RepID=UPI00301D4E27
MKPNRILIAALALAVAAVQARAEDSPTGPAPRTRNVVVVMTDGLRWQEVFGGADRALLNKEAGGVADVGGLKARFDRDTPEARREVLLPFMTNVVAAQGRLYGEGGEGSRVTNGKNFSYPGYSEVFTGFADPRIDSNDKFPNPNVNVLEWLNSRPEYRGKVAAFASWDVFPFILNRERSGMKVVSAWEPLGGEELSPREKMLDEVKADVHRLWAGVGYDAFTFHGALEYLRREKPRVLFIGLGETDDFAHAGRYDNYLDSAHKFDQYVARLWETLQSMPEYKDATTLILTTDHGRGDAPTGWKSHGAEVPGADRMWVGILGPDTPARGETSLGSADQNQVAATLAALLGEDYNAYQPKAGPVIADAVGRRQAPADR